LGEWIEKETEAIVKANSNDEELPGIVVGGDILTDEQISGKGGHNGPIPGSPAPESITPSNGQVKNVNGEEVQEKLQSVIRNGHLFNLVAKGIDQ
jgi:hypothetical protein